MFKITKKSKKSHARVGTLKTGHGLIKTPFFMPVATQAAVKHISTKEMESLGAQIILSNTYHLMLKPGEKLIEKANGLHRFMDWHKPILTDSGGFQVFSLAGTKKKSGESLVKLTRQGVKFKSYINGHKYYLTPEKALKIQLALGSDIVVSLDECVALPATKKRLEAAVELTTDWAKKTKNYYEKFLNQSDRARRTNGLKQPGSEASEPGCFKPLLFAVIQGGLNKQLRLKSLRDLEAIGFDGYNIGGLSVGETAKEMYKVLDYLCLKMPENKPRYLMGVGYPENILAAVIRGVDMFDCVIPTREGRHGRLFQISDFKKEKDFYKKININRAKFAKNFTPINLNSKLPQLRKYTLAYLHYLFKIKEPLGQRLASLNNLEFYLDLMEKIRYSIRLNKI